MAMSWRHHLYKAETKVLALADFVKSYEEKEGGLWYSPRLCLMKSQLVDVQLNHYLLNVYYLLSTMLDVENKEISRLPLLDLPVGSETWIS